MLIFTTLIHKVIRSILLWKWITHLICIIICWKRRRIIRVIHIILWLRGRRLNRRSVRMKRRIRRSWGKRGNRGRIEGWTLISFFIHKIGLWRSFYFVREHSKCIRERGLIRFPWFAALIWLLIGIDSRPFRRPAFMSAIRCCSGAILLFFIALGRQGGIVLDMGAALPMARGLTSHIQLR